MNLLDKLKEMMNKKDSKKFTSNLLVLLSIGIILLIASKVFLKDESGTSSYPVGDSTLDNRLINEKNYLIDDYAKNIEDKLQEILGQIKGVGSVKVMVTLEDTAERIPVFNTTSSQEKSNEKDSQGGTRETSREDQTYQVVTGKGSDSLLIVKEVKPKVKGVIVVAEGAEDIQVKERLYAAVRTVLGISANRVEVFSSN